MHPLSKTQKKAFFPMELVKFLLSVFVNKFVVICRYTAYTISEFFVISQIVKQFSFNIGLRCTANLLKPAKGWTSSPFFISINLFNC